MQKGKTDLSAFDNSWYKPGNALKRIFWYFTNVLIFNHGLFPFSRLKVLLLRLFGAKIGRSVLIKPSVNIKYPWNLVVGDNVWIGENVWIDNLATTTLGSNVCLSQGAMLLTGNHNFSKVTFDLMVAPIILEEGVWIGARALVGPGVTCRSHAVLAVESVASNDLEEYSIYRGNPAVRIRERQIQ